MSERVKAADATWITNRLPTKDDGEIVLTWCHDRWTDMHYSQVLNGTVWMRQPPPYQPPPPEPDTSLGDDAELVMKVVDWAVQMAWSKNVKKALNRIITAARKVEELEKEVERQRIWKDRWKDSFDKLLEMRDDKPAADHHAGDCTWYASDNGRPEDGICTCGYGLRSMRKGDYSNLVADWRESKPVTDPPTLADLGCTIIDTDPDGVGDGWRLLKGNDRPDNQLGDEVAHKDMDDWGETAMHGEETISEISDSGSLFRYRRRIEPATNDPDDVGEGWERCKAVDADEFRRRGDIDWNSLGMTPMSWFFDNAKTLEFRRRINPAEAPVVSSGDSEQAPVVTTEQPAKVRREWTKDCYVDDLFVVRVSGTTQRFDVEHIREVLPDDPTPGWTEELIRLCIDLCKCPLNSDTHRWTIGDISKHLAKRGER